MGSNGQNGQQQDWITLPADVETEKALLAGVLRQPVAMGDLTPMVQAEDFSNHDLAQIWMAMVDIHERGQMIERPLVEERLRQMGRFEQVGGRVVLFDLSVSLDGYFPHTAARVVHEIGQRRGLIGAMHRVLQAASEGARPTGLLIQDLEETIAALREDRPLGMRHIGAVVREVTDMFAERMHHPGAFIGVPTGFYGLDQMTGGLQKSELILLAGRPSMGKTALALDVAFHAATHEHTPVAIFSLEMSAQALVQRVLCGRSTLDANLVRRSAIPEEAWQRITLHAAEMAQAEIYVNDQGALTLSELAQRMRAVLRQVPIGLVIIDYLQLMAAPNAENRQQSVSALSRGLKLLAKDCQVPVLALSQLSRDVEHRGKDGKPRLADLRDSGSLEQDADVVVFVWRPGEYGVAGPDGPGGFRNAALVVAKQRNGPTGDVWLHWQPQWARFVNPAPEGTDAHRV